MASQRELAQRGRRVDQAGDTEGCAGADDSSTSSDGGADPPSPATVEGPPGPPGFCLVLWLYPSRRQRLRLRSLLRRAVMSFVRFVEIGRVCLITYGPDAGKLATIVNILDNNRVLVDGPMPLTGVHRHAINLKRVQLTDIVVPAKLNSSQKYAAAFPCQSRISLAPRCLDAVAHGGRLRLRAPPLWRASR